MGARRRATLIAVLTILAGGIAAFANSFQGQFIFDDLLALTQNPSTERLWRLDHVLRPPIQMTVGGRPMLNLSFAIDRAIFGLHPAGYHIGNLLIHLLAALALFGIIRRTWKGAPDGVWIAASVALLWVVHPLQTESVTYLVQRAESLMGLFYLLTLYTFLRSAEGSNVAESGTISPPGREPVLRSLGEGGRTRSTFALLSIVCCWLGMATKEAMVSAPLIVLLYDRTFLTPSFAAIWRARRAYYLALFAAWLPLAALILSTHGRGGTVGVGLGVGVMQYWATQFPAVVRYVWLAFWPNPLVFDYGTEWIENWTELVPCAAVVLILIGLTVNGLRRFAPAGFVGFFFFAILAPTSLMPGVRQTSAEHRMYLPLAAVLVAAVTGAYWAWGRRTLLAWPLLAIILGKLTHERNWFYAHPVAMWQDTVSKRPGNPYSRNNYGGALLAAQLPANALIQLKESVRLKPDFMEGHGNLGSAYLRTGDLRNALNEYQMAVQLGPKYAAVHNNFGVALLSALELARAQEEFETAIRIDPEFGEAYNNLGNAKLRQGHPAAAAEAYRRALQIQPNLPRTRELLQRAEELSAKPPPSLAPSP
jgi:tetratricopeptide (TPR) repeat protein